MMLNILVDSYTQKILSREYGTPIKIDRRHILYAFIYSSYKKTEPPPEFTSPLLIEASSKNINPRAGLFLRRYCRTLQNNFIYSQVMAPNGIEATEAMNNFNTLYGLCEDDIALDSVYRSWQRFINQKKQSLSCKNTAQYVRSHYRVITRAELENFLAAYCLECLPSILGRKWALTDQVINQARIYIYYTHGQIPAADIARELGLVQSSVYYHVAKFQSRISKEQFLPYPDPERFGFSFSMS